MTHIDIFTQAGIKSVLFNEPLSRHCTWRIGGPADVLVAPGSVAELAALLRIIHTHSLGFVVIGDGSNILFSDDGFRGVVIRIGRGLSGCVIEGTTVHVQAGMAVPRLARKAALAGLTGLEHTAGIPGTVGGLAAMNGGSLGRSIGERIRTVRCLDECGRVVELDRSACGFAYRRSVFLDKPWVITEAVLELETGDKAAIAGTMRGILRERRSKYPRRMPNCGSVFKSHPEIYAQYGPPGKVIEELGLKGTRIGDAEVSRLHANFIVNNGHARAADVLELIRMIGERVYEKTGVRMECEVRIVQ